MDSIVPQAGHGGGSGGTATVPPVFRGVLCHGVHSDSRQMAPVSRAWRSRFPGASFMLADAPHVCRGSFWRAQGRQWFSLEQPRDQQMAAAAEAAEGLNLRVDAELKRLALPPGAVVYCGFSQGAMVVLLAGLMRAAAPLGIAAMAGSLLAPEGGFVPRCRPPVLLVHGAEDCVVPASRSEEAARRLRAAGMRVQLEILPLLGHLIVPDAAPHAADFIASLAA